MSTHLEAQWIVGFTDGEGCFNLDVHLHKDTKWGIQMQPEFTVVQGEVDVNILHALKNRFGCGTVAVNRKDQTSTRMMYRVKNIKDCHTIIVPFFEQHQLKTKKRVEFERFRTIVRLMHEGYHRQSLRHFLEILEKGEQLRVRQRPADLKKREKVTQKIAELRQKLEEDPTL
uniref:LAGLIDADG endonuclease n=1 Tax=Pediastrum duplex TaxID=3105 RepID=A0A1W5RMK7_PEDDU|nr:LAGLIDADG endonuclease [Pediastrum duplex]YP_009364107.1 LAGLIDADG endonuclease [Pediastrum duplex]AQU64439.1 LAGLIDADG endonuclease [Pediastrum duplex]ARK36696.1 LAGLIDADG endonuclease [Pediastrum duplex]